MFEKFCYLLAVVYALIIISTVYMNAQCSKKGGFPAPNGVCLKKESLLK